MIMRPRDQHVYIDRHRDVIGYASGEDRGLVSSAMLGAGVVYKRVW